MLFIYGLVSLQVLSALDILQPPTLDFFQEMYPFICLIALSNKSFGKCGRLEGFNGEAGTLTSHVSPIAFLLRAEGTTRTDERFYSVFSLHVIPAAALLSFCR